MKAKERKTKATQIIHRSEAVLQEKVEVKNLKNKKVVVKAKIAEQKIEEEAQEKEALIARRERLEQIKEEVLHKKGMARLGREQHEVVRKVKEDFNPYAAKINNEIHEKTLLMRSKQQLV